MIYMNKKELLFYDAYEAFYAMAKISEAFRAYCKDAFGEDLSQDGFSDVAQIDRILPFIPKTGHAHILDIGCGNGKMLGYLQQKTHAHIYGFDYSSESIRTAKQLFPEHSEFLEGTIGEITYPKEKFDVIISMDTMYFAQDMTAFVAQIKSWLKPNGVLFVGYQEGDVMPKTANAHTTVLAQALEKNAMVYDTTDITQESYTLLKRKRNAALKYREAFDAEGHEAYFRMLIGQTEYASEPYPQFQEKMARYIYVAKKHNAIST